MRENEPTNPTPPSRCVIVVPCYNEAARLDRAAFAAFVRDHPHVHLLFVDDGSRDDTAGVLNAIRAQAPDHVRVLRLEPNRGKGEAVRHGILEAVAGEDSPACVGFFDADLATPLSEALTMLAVLAERPQIDAVFGSRVNLLGRHVRRNLLRHWVGRIFATAAATLLRLPIYDTQCGAKLFRNNARTMRLFDHPFTTGFIFDVELIARMVVQPRTEPDCPPAAERIVEQPLMRWYDVAGSKLRPRHVAWCVVDLAKIWKRYLRAGARDH